LTRVAITVEMPKEGLTSDRTIVGAGAAAASRFFPSF